MMRYFANDVAGNIVLDKQFHHHLQNVLRSKVGDLVELVINKKLYIGQIVTLKPLTFKIIEAVITHMKEKPIHLIFCLLKGDKVDFVIQKAVELGVNSITLTASEHTIIKWSQDDINKKRSRYEKIILEAAMQAKRLEVASLNINLNFNEAIINNFGQKFIAHEQLHNEQIFNVNFNKQLETAILIGPEGGFSPIEYQFALQNGYLGVSLGETILRAETASIASLAIINYLYE